MGKEQGSYEHAFLQQRPENRKQSDGEGREEGEKDTSRENRKAVTNTSSRRKKEDTYESKECAGKRTKQEKKVDKK